MRCCGGPFCNVGLGCLLLYWAQVFWIRELRPVQLQLILVRFVRKLCLVCQEHAHAIRATSDELWQVDMIIIIK